MNAPRSLQARLALGLGAVLTALLIAAASVTAVVVAREMDQIFDAALQETAQRILPLAVVDIIGREGDMSAQRLGMVRAHDELFIYVVRDAEGRVLLQSHSADPGAFPAYDGPGFRRTAAHRLNNEDALQGSVTITMAEPLAHRRAVARDIQIGLGLPLVIVIPVALIAIAFGVRGSLRPLPRFRDRLAARDARDLSPVPVGDVPPEIAPMAATLIALLARLQEVFDPERSLAAKAAHEVRTLLAGPIAQAQRLQS
ncbi:MAG: two-component system OmpR family sensor kinase [Paracoccaceae bacterium]|jgi:two-component system OmpR family sensor kinase